MKTFRCSIVIAIFLSFCFSGHAQIVDGAFGYFNDAILFGRTQTNGTARVQGMGGAHVGVGGDISSAHMNPAGLGFFNRGAFTITPNVGVNNTESQFFDTSMDASRSNFNLQNFGFVFNSSKDDLEAGDWKGGSFAINVTRTNTFQRNMEFEGANDFSSAIDAFIDRANGTNFNQLSNNTLEGLAYETYLINPTGDPSLYDSFILGYPVQYEERITRGSQYSWDFSWGGNYADKIYFGAGVGITSISYSLESIYEEYDFVDFENPNAASPIDFFQIDDRMRIDGVGINAKFGLIYRVADPVRIGISYQTPTAHAMSEELNLSMFARYNNFEFIEDGSPVTLNDVEADSDGIISNYTLVTPGRVSLGSSFFFGKHGFIAADVDYVDYGGATLRSNNFSMDADNRSIENLYQSAINLRVGGEYRYNRLRVRAGYGRMGDPFRTGSVDRTINTFSAGLGLHMRNYFLDLTAVQNRFADQYRPYESPIAELPQPDVRLDNLFTNVMLTWGILF